MNRNSPTLRWLGTWIALSAGALLTFTASASIASAEVSMSSGDDGGGASMSSDEDGGGISVGGESEDSEGDDEENAECGENVALSRC